MWGCKMNELNFQQEISRLCLQIITPVNIADGTKLTAKDYFYEPEKQKAYFLNLHKWHQFIYQHGLLEAYEKYVSDAYDKRNLLAWLQAQKLTLAAVQDIIVTEAQATVNLVNVDKKNTLNDVDKHIHQTDGSLYVPGSSIKGVFRSAILYAMLKKKPAIKNRYWQAINEELANPRFNPRKSLARITTSLESDLLHTLQLDSQNKSNAVCSSLRGLQVSDTLSSENMQVAILQKVDAGFDKFGKASTHLLPIFKECMLPGAKLYFDVKLDKVMLATIGMSSIDDLLSVTQNYFAAVMNLLRDAFGEQYPEQFMGLEKANMFLGSNTGFLSKTILALLAPDAKAAKDAIKILLDKSFKGHKHFMRDKVISPRTLKCTKYNGKLLLMGLAEVRHL